MSDRERLEDRHRRRMALVAFTTVLVAASVFVISDAYFDLSEAPPDLLTVLEAAVAVALVFGSFLGIAELRRNHRLLDSHEEALAAASGALAEVIEAQFAEWRLTPAEREIGMLALKGFDIAEIAQLRGARHGAGADDLHLREVRHIGTRPVRGIFRRGSACRQGGRLRPPGQSRERSGGIGRAIRGAALCCHPVRRAAPPCHAGSHSRCSRPRSRRRRIRAAAGSAAPRSSAVPRDRG